MRNESLEVCPDSSNKRQEGREKKERIEAYKVATKSFTISS